jgi:hypothetical protein
LDDVGYCSKAEWVINGHKRKRFLAKYDAAIREELKDKNPEEVNAFLMKRYVSSLCNKQISMCNKKEMEKTLNKMKRHRDLDSHLINEGETELFFATLSLQRHCTETLDVQLFSCNRLLATPIFYKMMTEEKFFLLKFLHCPNNESYSKEVFPKISKAELVFDHLIQKFLESYIPEDRLSVGESLLLWNG